MKIMLLQSFVGTDVFVLLFLFIISAFLVPLFELTNSWIVKVRSDLKIHNSAFLSNLVTIFDIEDFLCTEKCEQLTNGLSNLRSYNYLKKSCECFHASAEFRDSRDKAPILQSTLLYVNGEYLIFFRKVWIFVSLQNWTVVFTVLKINLRAQ